LVLLIRYSYDYLLQSIFNLSLFFILGGGAYNVLGLQDVVVASTSGKVTDVFNGRLGDYRQGLLGEFDRKNGCRKLKLAWKSPFGKTICLF